MAIVSTEIPANLRDFSLLDLIVLVQQESMEIASLATVLITKKYGIDGAKCLLVLKDHTPSNRKQVKSYMQELLKIDVDEVRYSSVRSNDEMKRFAQPYPALSAVAMEVALCELLSAK